MNLTFLTDPLCLVVLKLLLHWKLFVKLEKYKAFPHLHKLSLVNLGGVLRFGPLKMHRLPALRLDVHSSCVSAQLN